MTEYSRIILEEIFKVLFAIPVSSVELRPGIDFDFKDLLARLIRNAW